MHVWEVRRSAEAHINVVVKRACLGPLHEDTKGNASVNHDCTEKGLKKTGLGSEAGERHLTVR